MPSPIEILEEIIDYQKIELNYEEFWKVYYLSWGTLWNFDKGIKLTVLSNTLRKGRRKKPSS